MWTGIAQSLNDEATVWITMGSGSIAVRDKKIVLFTENPNRPYCLQDSYPIREPVAFSCVVNRPRREDEHSSLTRTEIKNAWLYLYCIAYI